MLVKAVAGGIMFSSVHPILVNTISLERLYGISSNVDPASIRVKGRTDQDFGGQRPMWLDGAPFLGTLSQEHLEGIASDLPQTFTWIQTGCWRLKVKVNVAIWLPMLVNMTSQDMCSEAAQTCVSAGNHTCVRRHTTAKW